MSPETRRAVFLDRDGVLNRDRFPFIFRPRDYALLPGAADAVARLTRAGFPVFVATNKAAIGLKLLSPRCNEEITGVMLQGIEAAGGRITKVYHCPHVPFGRCSCRKPKPGMLERAAREFGVVPQGSWMVGDNVKDVRAGAAFGARTILLLTTHSLERLEREMRREGVKADFVASGLPDAVDVILKEAGR